MVVEFTGERVVPGKVSPDLWNEHLARYAFAARLARGKRVLDIGCGMGYGSAELARAAHSVVGVDISEQAIDEARSSYPAPNLQFIVSSAESIDLPSGTFDLIVAFEVIEHLENWSALLTEAKRLLAPSGQFMVSTPNRLYYEATRNQSGPNPYHVHEFEYQEFSEALEALYPSVRLFLQNHVAAIAFQPNPAPNSTPSEISIEKRQTAPEESHFFVAVCALAHQTGAPTYLFVPATANLLKEREDHIGLLKTELSTKNEWLEQLKTEHNALHELYQQQAAELGKRTNWATSLQNEIEEARRALEAYELELRRQRTEFEEERASVRATISLYEAQQAELETVAEQLKENQLRIQQDLDTKVQELSKCVDLLHAAEATVDERTRWALDLTSRIAQLEQTLEVVRGSRWLRLGRQIGVGPNLSKF